MICARHCTGNGFLNFLKPFVLYIQQRVIKLLRPHIPHYHPVMCAIPFLFLMLLAALGSDLAYAFVFIILVMVVTCAINAIIFSLELRSYQPEQQVMRTKLSFPEFFLGSK